MKKGSEIGINVIHTNAKEGTEELKTIHWKLNCILYQYHILYISKLDAVDIYNEVCALGTQISKLKVPIGAKSKKEEILAQLRIIASSLKSYISSFQWCANDVEKIQKSINFEVCNLIHDKKEGKFKQIGYVLEQLEEIRRLRLNMIKDSKMEESLNLKAILGFNDELVGIVNQRYQ